MTTLTIPSKFFGPKFSPGEDVKLEDGSWGTILRAIFCEPLNTYYYQISCSRGEEISRLETEIKF